MENSSNNKNFICHDCFRLKRCKDSAASWVFFIIALTATVAIRAVNVALDFDPLLAKIFWYVGVVGFTVFFLYKFRYNSLLQRELKARSLTKKILSKEQLDGNDYELLGTIVCQASSYKDKINYFFIFFFSGLALIFAVWIDFFKA